MKRMIKCLMIICLCLSMTGCAQSSGNVDENVGGWVDNDSHTEKPENTPEPDAKQDETETVETLEDYNTDALLSDIVVEIVEYLDRYIVYQVTNYTNNCYDYISGWAHFTADPLPDMQPPEDGMYEYGVSFYDIPAYSVTYHYKDAWGMIMGKEGQDEYQGVLYYDFELGEDVYIIALSSEEGDYRVSSALMQDASEYITVDSSSKNLSNNQLCKITNSSDRIVKYSGFAVFSDGSIVDLDNGLSDMSTNNKSYYYHNAIAANNDPFRQITKVSKCDWNVCDVANGKMDRCEEVCENVEYEYYDSNSWYAKQNTSSSDYHIYTHAAYFVDTIVFEDE